MYFVVDMILDDDCYCDCVFFRSVTDKVLVFGFVAVNVMDCGDLLVFGYCALEMG